jgi:two-component system OmpR family response regulator
LCSKDSHTWSLAFADEANALLLLLLRHPDTILPRAQIEREIYSWNELVESNAVDVLIHSIRQKFDKDLVRNIRGAGRMVTRSESP